MDQATLRNVIAQEFRTLQTRINQQMLTRADLNAAVDRFNASVATKRDIADIKTALDQIRFELQSQRQVIKQQTAYIDALERNTKTHSNQLGTIWRFANSKQ